ncbi:class I SAM-dependent methyltransferase [Nioella nitratireducens]|uniref:class I SAM-dependent methyltransferase n=1 Tax=Nioella nitratireducens TaxID=1287720 RepID=UPI0008FD0129|nr:class I SAM-dependent methyltransferase [Nioella nitratireducens]
MTESTTEHWNTRYGHNAPEGLSWFEASPDLSLDLILGRSGPSDAVIDIGGGAARLPDALLAAGYSDLSVLDMSDEALALSRARLGAAAQKVAWITADIRKWRAERPYNLWHDRAVFHFLTDRDDQQHYIETMRQAIAPDGHAVILTFSRAGPMTCSGLPVQRYDPLDLVIRLEEVAPEAFKLETSGFADHVTPGGAVQSFQWSVLRRLDRV